MITIYQAEDGKFFATESACLAHEESLKQSDIEEQLTTFFYKHFVLSHAKLIANYVVNNQSQLLEILTPQAQPAATIDNLIIDGVEYVKTQEVHGCDMCAFQHCHRECNTATDLVRCSAENVIWIKKAV